MMFVHDDAAQRVQEAISISLIGSWQHDRSACDRLCNLVYATVLAGLPPARLRAPIASSFQPRRATAAKPPAENSTHMKKIPVLDSIRYAYAFTFGHLGTIIGLIWVPMVILAVAGYFVMSYYYGGVPEAVVPRAIRWPSGAAGMLRDGLEPGVAAALRHHVCGGDAAGAGPARGAGRRTFCAGRCRSCACSPACWPVRALLLFLLIDRGGAWRRCESAGGESAGDGSVAGAVSVSPGCWRSSMRGAAELPAHPGDGVRRERSGWPDPGSFRAAISGRSSLWAGHAADR